MENATKEGKMGGETVSILEYCQGTRPSSATHRTEGHYWKYYVGCTASGFALFFHASNTKHPHPHPFPPAHTHNNNNIAALACVVWPNPFPKPRLFRNKNTPDTNKSGVLRSLWAEQKIGHHLPLLYLRVYRLYRTRLCVCLNRACPHVCNHL